MINLRHIKKFLGLIILGLLLSSQSFADKKFDKDLKKVSKNNAFINNKGEVYSIEEISDKQNTILVIYSHGSGPDHKMEKCLKSWNKVPPIIRNLHNKRIKEYTVKIYRFCSGVRGGPPRSSVFSSGFGSSSALSPTAPSSSESGTSTTGNAFA